MTVTLERVVAGGHIVDAEQLMNEMLAAVDTIGSSCVGVGVSPPGPPNDTLWIVFEAAPDEVVVDAVIAAYVDGSGDYAWPSMIAAVAGAWQNVIKIPVEPSSGVEVDIAVKIRIGGANDFSVAKVYFDNIARRRGAGVVAITDALGLVRPYGDIPQYSFRLQPAVFSAQLQMRVQRSANVFFVSRRVDIQRERFT